MLQHLSVVKCKARTSALNFYPQETFLSFSHDDDDDGEHVDEDVDGDQVVDLDVDQDEEIMGGVGDSQGDVIGANDKSDIS